MPRNRNAAGIASELHDDFSQRLAVLSLGLENVEEATPASLSDVHTRLHRPLSAIHKRTQH